MELLSDGRIGVSADSNDATSVVESWDPREGSWKLDGSSHEWPHEPPLPPDADRVLERLPAGGLFALHLAHTNDPMQVPLYDQPMTVLVWTGDAATWTKLPNLPVGGRVRSVTRLAGGSVVMCLAPMMGPTTRLQLLSWAPNATEWTRLPDPPQFSEYGRLLPGGANRLLFADHDAARFHALDLPDGTWRDLGRPPNVRWGASAEATLDGKVLIVGGDHALHLVPERIAIGGGLLLSLLATVVGGAVAAARRNVLKMAGIAAAVTLAALAVFVPLGLVAVYFAMGGAAR
jgi:hypothetical protein